MGQEFRLHLVALDVLSGSNVNWCGSSLLDIRAFRGVGAANQAAFGENHTEQSMKQSSDWHWLHKI